MRLPAFDAVGARRADMLVPFATQLGLVAGALSVFALGARTFGRKWDAC